MWDNLGCWEEGIITWDDNCDFVVPFLRFLLINAISSCVLCVIDALCEEGSNGFSASKCLFIVSSASTSFGRGCGVGIFDICTKLADDDALLLLLPFLLVSSFESVGGDCLSSSSSSEYLLCLLDML